MIIIQQCSNIWQRKTLERIYKNQINPTCILHTKQVSICPWKIIAIHIEVGSLQETLKSSSGHQILVLGFHHLPYLCNKSSRNIQSEQSTMPGLWRITIFSFYGLPALLYYQSLIVSTAKEGISRQIIKRQCGYTIQYIHTTKQIHHKINLNRY